MVALGIGSGCTAIAVVEDGGLGGAGTLTTGASPTTTLSGAPTSSTAGGFATSGGTQSGSPSTTSGASGSTNASASASSGGVPCIPADCSDAEPCTIDTCNVDGSCTHEARAPGMPGDLAEGACEGVCQVDGHCGLAHYRRDVASATWTKAALSQIWNGANAPPPRGILAADSGITYELMVIADDGMVYQRQGGVWQPPVAGTTLWGIDTNQAGALLTYNFGGDDLVILTFTQGGTNYSVFATVNGTSVAAGQATPAEDQAGYPAASYAMSWAVVTQDPNQGQLQWYRFADANVYLWNNSGFAGTYAETNSGVWGDPATAPQPGTVRAALAAGTEIQLVAP